MPTGDRTNYNDPEHDKKLRELGKGGLTRTPGCAYPSKEQPPLPYVHDENGSEITVGDWVRIEEEVYKVRAVDVSAMKVDIGNYDMELATDCVGVVRSIDELAEDGVIPEGAKRGGKHYHQYERKFYDAQHKPLATHPDYRFSSKVVRSRRDSVRKKDAARKRDARARQKDEDDEVAPRVLDGSGQMAWRKDARLGARKVAAALKTCPCGSGLDSEWCNKCDLPDSGKSWQKFSVATPLYGGTSDDSHKELTGMSREDFAKYLEACMHPAPPDVKAELLGAKRMLFGVPVGSMEREHVCPKSAYVRSLGRRQVIGFEADGTTPNAAARGAYRFCEFQWMYWRQNARKGRGFSDDLRLLYEERLLCCMSQRSLALYKVDRLDPQVKFYSIGTIVSKLKAWGEARAEKLESEVFVPIGAPVNWLAEARVGMAEDDREIKAWRRGRGEDVEDEDEEEAAVNEHDRQRVARERAARCVEIKLTAPHAIDAM